MKKIIHIVLKVVLSLLLIMPALGALGIFPAPTADMYTTPQAYQFIVLLMEAQYIMILMTIVHVIALIALWSKREGLAALLELPIVLNIVGFHAFLDGGLFAVGAIMADVFFLLVVYFAWVNREQYKTLLQKH